MCWKAFLSGTTRAMLDDDDEETGLTLPTDLDYSNSHKFASSFRADNLTLKLHSIKPHHE